MSLGGSSSTNEATIFHNTLNEMTFAAGAVSVGDWILWVRMDNRSVSGAQNITDCAAAIQDESLMTDPEAIKDHGGLVVQDVTTGTSRVTIKLLGDVDGMTDPQPFDNVTNIVSFRGV